MRNDLPIKHIVGVAFVAITLAVWLSIGPTSYADADDDFPLETDIALAPDVDEPPYQSSYRGNQSCTPIIRQESKA